jgi:hypothetical protein
MKEQTAKRRIDEKQKPPKDPRTLARTHDGGTSK